MNIFISVLLISLTAMSCSTQPSLAQTTGRKITQPKSNAVSNATAPVNGTYYIVQVSSGHAITPKGITQVTNEIYLKPFNKGGLQKWILKRRKDGRYTLSPEGNTELYFTTFSDSPHWTAITDNRVGDTYTIKAVPGTSTYFTIHSKYYNGDALKSTVVGGYEEIKFSPLESNPKFHWEFIPVQ